MDKDCGRNPAISYMVRIHGSRAPTQRNRKFLKKNSPFHPMIPVQQDEFIPAPMVLRERADQGHAVEQPALLDHPVGYPTTAQQLSSLSGQSTLLTSLLMSSPQLLLLRLSTLLLLSCSPYQDQPYQPYLPRSPLQLHTTGSSQLLLLVRMSWHS